MNKKETGAAVRRGILTGTLAGFVAGWLAFAGYAKKFDSAEAQAVEDVRDRAAQLVLPAIPGLPPLGPLPTAQAYRAASGPNRPMPRIVIPRAGAAVPPVQTAAPVAATAGAQVIVPVAAAPAPVAMPTFAPLPPLPPLPKPTAVTKTS